MTSPLRVNYVGVKGQSIIILQIVRLKLNNYLLGLCVCICVCVRIGNYNILFLQYIIMDMKQILNMYVFLAFLLIFHFIRTSFHINILILYLFNTY